MNTEVSLFQLSDDKSIIFRYNQFSGMVGETYYSQSFDVINNETLEVVGSKISKRRRTAERSYNLLKEFYKRVEGKARRIEFHSQMKIVWQMPLVE